MSGVQGHLSYTASLSYMRSCPKETNNSKKFLLSSETSRIKPLSFTFASSGQSNSPKAICQNPVWPEVNLPKWAIRHTPFSHRPLAALPEGWIPVLSVHRRTHCLVFRNESVIYSLCTTANVSPQDSQSSLAEAGVLTSSALHGANLTRSRVTKPVN